MPTPSKKIVYVLGIALVGLATTLAVNDFQFSQTYRYYNASASQIFGVTQLAVERARVAPQPPASRNGFQIKLHEGWNLLGTAGSPIGLASVKGCRFDGPALGYDGQAYYDTGQLEMGRGYWVYVMADCVAELPGNAMVKPAATGNQMVPPPANQTEGALPQEELRRIKERLYQEQQPTTSTNRYDLMKEKLLKEYEQSRDATDASGGESSATTDTNSTNSTL